MGLTLFESTPDRSTRNDPMTNGHNNPDSRDLWIVVNELRSVMAELEDGR